MIRKQNAVWLVMFVFLFTGFAACNNGKHSEKIKPAIIDSIAKIQDPSARIIALDKTINSEPRNARLYILRSKAYNEAGNLDSALKNCKTAIDLDSSNANWYFYMSDLFMSKPSVKNAVSIMETLTQRQPRNKMAYIRLAELYIDMGDKDEKGRYPKSLENIDKALKIDPNLPEAYFWLGYNYKETKMTDKAIASFQKAVNLKPDYTDAYVYLGLLSAQKKDPKALEYFTTAIRLNPKDTAALYARGKYNQDRDSFNLAMKDYRSMLDLDANLRRANYSMGYCLYSLNKYDDALGYFSKVLLNNPNDAAAHYGRSLCYKAMGEHEKAAKELEISDKLSGQH